MNTMTSLGDRHFGKKHLPRPRGGMKMRRKHAKMLRKEYLRVLKKKLKHD